MNKKIIVITFVAILFSTSLATATSLQKENIEESEGNNLGTFEVTIYRYGAYQITYHIKPLMTFIMPAKQIKK